MSSSDETVVPRWFERLFGSVAKTHRKLSKKVGPRFAVLILALPIVLLLAVPTVALNLIPGNESSCLVTGKDRAGNGSSMRVYTDNCGTFGVQDNALLLRFDSADAYGNIQVGQAYDFRTAGVRIHLLSMFPNILEATPAP